VTLDSKNKSLADLYNQQQQQLSRLKLSISNINNQNQQYENSVSNLQISYDQYKKKLNKID